MRSVKYKNLDEFEPAFCSTGDGFETEYGYNSEGELVIVGKINVQEIIESHRDECDIEALIARSLAGDTNALCQRAGQFIDAVDLPKDLVELQTLRNNSETLVNSLSEEDRKAFFDDPEKFFESKSAVKTDDQKKAELVEALRNLTGKEVTINE